MNSKRSFWQRFVDGKTSGQRLLLTLGALAGALLAVGGLATAVVKLVGQENSGRSTLADAGVVAN